MPAIEITKMVKSGEMKSEADTLLEKAKEDKRDKEAPKSKRAVPVK